MYLLLLIHTSTYQKKKGSLGTEINKSKSVAFAAHSNYNFQTQESINKKTKQNKTTIMILRVAMQIRTIVDETKTRNKTEANISKNSYLTTR